jgi:CheY-like chemotaxis protein
MILDVMMTHDTEGFEVSRKVFEDPALKSIKILMVTGIRREKDLPYSLEPDETWLPVERVLEKPVPPEQLLKEIEQTLAG